MAYSEALGQLRIWNRNRTYGKTPDECFLAFFDEMHRGSYKRWREAWEQSHAATIYEVLRCGLVHEYRPKVNSKFWIGDGDELGLADEDGYLIFKVEPYFRHFAAEADRLHEELKRLVGNIAANAYKKLGVHGAAAAVAAHRDAHVFCGSRIDFGPIRERLNAGRSA
ncbi:MAG: hypothetical protein ACRDF0_05920 [Candidatus Limnocylindria bacterium]